MRYFFWKLSGGDITIIRKCASTTQKTFSRLGIFVFIFIVSVFLGFLASNLYFFDVIVPAQGEYSSLSSVSFANESPVAGILLAVASAMFMTFVFGNIYLLTITTFSKNSLPLKTHVPSKLFSNVLRIAFISFFAVLISKPIEVLFLQGSDRLNVYVKEHKEDIVRRAEHNANLLNQDTNGDLLSKLKASVENGNYFMYKLRVISTEGFYAPTWLISLLLVFVFLIPVVVKRKMKDSEDYFQMSKDIQMDIVERHYAEFKERYNELMLDQTGRDHSFYETFEDPPFNTIKKTDPRTFKKQQDFLSLFKPNVNA